MTPYDQTLGDCRKEKFPFDRKKPLDRGGATICCVTGEGFCLYVFVFLLPIKYILVHQLAGSFLGFII